LRPFVLLCHAESDKPGTYSSPGLLVVHTGAMVYWLVVSKIFYFP
jgi:hypothetical protein